MRNNVKTSLSILFFLQFIIWGGWMVTLGSYLLHKLNFTGQEVGYIYGSTAIAATISPFLLGILADKKFATEKLLAFLHITGGIVMLFCTQTSKFSTFYPLFIIYTLLYMPTFSLTNSLSFRHLKNIENDFPKVRVWGTIAWIVVGLVISLFIWEETVYPLYISIIFSFLSAAWTLYIPKTPPSQSQQRKHWIKSIGGALWPYFKKRSLLFLLVALVLIRIPSSFYYSFINPYLIDINISFPTAKMTLGQISEIIIMLSMPFLMKRIAAKWILAFGFFWWGFRYFLFDLGADSMWMIYAAILAHGITFNFGNLAAQIYIDRMVPERLRSTAQGLVILITMGIGVLIGSYFAGWVVDLHTIGESRIWDKVWDYPFIIGIGICILFLIFYPNKPIKNVDE